MESHWPQQVTIIGLGLIGGSIGLAIQQRYPNVDVIGVDRDSTACQRARERGAIRAGYVSLQEGVSDADLVVLATPVSAILEHVDQLPSFIDTDALVTDVGSTKRTICERGHTALGARFVGGHPMTGSEQSGIDAARTELFQNAVWVLERDAHDPPRHLVRFLETLGAQVMTMAPAHHDRVVAATSHLPQLLSVTLGAQWFDRAESDPSYATLISSGGRDWLRLAHSSPKIWRDIVATNADPIRDAIRSLIAELKDLDDDLGRWEDDFWRAQRLANSARGSVRWTHPNGGGDAYDRETSTRKR